LLSAKDRDLGCYEASLLPSLPKRDASGRPSLIMDNANKPSSTTINIVAFSTAAAASAAVIAIATYIYLSKKAALDPQDILSRCQAAIEQIETDLGSVV